MDIKYKVGFRHKHLKKISDPNYGWGSFKTVYDRLQDAIDKLQRLREEEPDRGDYIVRPLFPYEYKDKE